MHKFTKSLCKSRSSYFWNHSSELDTLVNQYSHATPIRSPVRGRTSFSKSMGLRASVPFFPLPHPAPSTFLLSPHFSRGQNAKNSSRAWISFALRVLVRAVRERLLRRLEHFRSDVTDSSILESFFSPALETNWLTHQLTHEKCYGFTIHKILTTVKTLKLQAIVAH